MKFSSITRTSVMAAALAMALHTQSADAGTLNGSPFAQNYQPAPVVVAPPASASGISFSNAAQFELQPTPAGPPVPPPTTFATPEPTTLAPVTVPPPAGTPSGTPAKPVVPPPAATPSGTPAKPVVPPPAVPAGKPARCSIHGDPHVSTFDSRAFPFMQQGVFTMFASGALEVQVFQEYCDREKRKNDYTCARGAAIAYGNSVVRLFVDNKKIVAAKSADADTQWLSVEKLGGKTDAYRVFLSVDKTSFVDVTLVNHKTDPYLNIVLQAAPLLKANGDIKGVCGNWNGNSKDDPTQAADVAAKNSVSKDSNLFTCSDASCATRSASAADEAFLASRTANDDAKLHQGYSPVSLTKRTFDTTRLSDKKKLRALRTQESTIGSNYARELCNRVLVDDIPACARYLPEETRSQYVDEVCAADVVLMNDIGLVDSAKIAYLRECRREMDTILDLAAESRSLDDETETVEADRAALSFGDVEVCVGSCSGRGTCLAAGCECQAGFTGLSCQIDLSA